MSRIEISRAENIRIAKTENGMNCDTGRANDRSHRFANPLTSRQIKYAPLTPPTDLTITLPQLYRSMLTDHLCHRIAAIKFSTVWDAIHGRAYTWHDYFETIPERPDESNPTLYVAWANANPDPAKTIDDQWTKFLTQFKGP